MKLGEEEATARDPLDQFLRWLEEARAGEGPWAEAAVLATATLDGRPSARAVILRGCDESGFAFDSDYQSRKAEELDANPWAALVFLWPQRERQVRVEGRIEKARPAESDAHFQAAPRTQQLAIRASGQSQVVAHRQELERRLGEEEAEHRGGDVPRPARWGGYRLRPTAIEFWQARPDRLHDRLRYRRQADGRWGVDRLSP